MALIGRKIMWTANGGQSQGVNKASAETNASWQGLRAGPTGQWSQDALSARR